MCGEHLSQINLLIISIQLTPTINIGVGGGGRLHDLISSDPKESILCGGCMRTLCCAGSIKRFKMEV